MEICPSFSNVAELPEEEKTPRYPAPPGGDMY